MPVCPQHRRPGLPEYVAALVDRVRADEVSLTLVNTDLVEGRSVLSQAGSFGEHQFTDVRLAIEAGPDQSVAVEAPHLRVHLGPAAQARLHLGLNALPARPPTVSRLFEH